MTLVSLTEVLPAVTAPAGAIAAYNIVQLEHAEAYATAAERAQVARDLNLDAPLPVQYVTYLGNLLQGDLGVSTQTRQPVANLPLAALRGPDAAAALARLDGRFVIADAIDDAREFAS